MRNLIRGWCLLAVCVATAGAAELFAELGFNAACQKATQEKKLVFIDFFTTWCGPCKLLDKNTWTDAGVIQLLKEKTVPLRIDAEQEVKLAERYKIDAYPTMLILKADGTEVDRLVGYQEPKPFVANFNAAISGKDSVARATEAVEKAGGKDPMARQALAKSLTQKHKYAEALDEYLWCYDHGIEANPAFIGVRSSFLLADIASLGRKYPPAREALENRRDALAKKIVGAPDQQAVADLISLNENLGAQDQNVRLFDQLPPNHEVREFVKTRIIDQLLIAKRYKDVLEGTEPEMIFRREAGEMELLLSRIDKNSPMRESVEKVYRQMTVTTGLNYFEALAGTGKNEAAKALGERVLKYDDSARPSLIQRAERAGNPRLAKDLSAP